MQPQRNVVPRDSIRALLANRGLTQSALAAHLGLTQQAVSLKLAGRRRFSAEELQAAAAFLGVHPGELFEPAPASDAVSA